MEYEGLDEGTHLFEVIAIDDEVESEPAQWQWTIDTEAPQVVDLVGPPELTNEEEAAFTFTCSKEECTYECRLGDAQMQSCAPGIVYENLDDGPHTFVVVPTDDLGTVGPPPPGPGSSTPSPRSSTSSMLPRRRPQTIGRPLSLSAATNRSVPSNVLSITTTEVAR